MKHLKKFRINENIELEPKSNWDDYVKELFQKYMDLDIEDNISRLENKIESLKGEIEKWKKVY